MVPVGSKIVLYGASEVGQEYAEQIDRTGYADIVLWVDRDYRLFTGLDVKPPESVKEIPTYDYVVVAVSNVSTYANVQKRLEDMGVSIHKIIWQVRK